MKIVLESNEPEEFLKAMNDIFDKPLKERRHYNNYLDGEINMAANKGDRTRFFELIFEQWLYKDFFEESEITFEYSFSCDRFIRMLAE